MSADDHQALVQWREALLRLAKAEPDIIGARTLLAGGQAELAACHVQWALEKTLKALLIAAAQDLRRTHDIDSLATLARTHWPDLLPSPSHWRPSPPLSGPRRVVTGNR
jgi:HEPN domain-containing protein